VNDRPEKPIKSRTGFFRSRLTRVLSWITGLSLGAIVFTSVIILASLAIFVRTDTFQNGLRDRILSLAREELGANITFQTASVSFFNTQPKIEFSDVHLQPLRSNVSAEFRRIAVGISPFSIPLLFFRELHLAYAEIEGVTYDLHSTKTIEGWIDSLRPKRSYLPSTFQTSIEKVLLKDVDLNVDLPPDDIFKQAILAKLHLEQIETKIDSTQIRYSGSIQFSNTHVGSRGPYEGSLSLDDASTKGDRTRFKTLNLQVGEDSFELSGEVKRPADPILDIKGHLKARLQSYFEVNRVGGVVDSTLAIRGPWKTMEGEGSIHMDGFHYDEKYFRQVNGDWVLKNSKLELKSMKLKDGDEEIVLQGLFPLHSPDNCSFQAKLTNINFGSALGLAAPPLVNWKGATSGTVKYDGTVAPSFKGNFEWDLNISDFQIRTKMTERTIFATPELKVAGKGSLDGLWNGIFTSDLSMGDSRWSGGGKWSSEGFDLNWGSSFQGASVGELFSRDLKLAGQMKGSLKGPWKNLVMNVDPALSAFILNGVKLSNLSGRLVLADRVLFGSPLITDELSVNGGIRFEKEKEKPETFSDFKFSSKDLNVAFLFDLFRINGELAQSMHGFASVQGFLKGPLTRPIGSGSLQIDNWNFKTDKTRGRTAKAKWATAGAETYFDSIEVRATPTSDPIRGEMSFDLGGLVDLSIEGRKLQVQNWIYLIDPALGLQGLADLDVDYQRATPSMKSRISLYETTLGGEHQENSELNLDWVGDKFKLMGNVLGESLVLSLEGSQTSKMREVQMKVGLRHFNAIPLFRFFEGSRLELLVSGEGDLVWKQPRSDCRELLFCVFREPKIFSGNVRVENASVQRGKVVLQEVDPFNVQISSVANGVSRYNSDHIRLHSGGHQLDIKGYFETEKNFSVSVHGQTELRSVASLYPQLSRSDGLAEVDGVLDAQGFTGKIELSDGLLSFQNSPIVIRNVAASVRAQDSSFELTRLSGEFKEGAVTGSGRFRLVGSDFDSAQISLRLENSLLQPQEGLSFRVAGPLNLQLTKERGNIDGRLAITEGMFRRRIDARIDVLKVFEPKKREFKNFTEETENLKPWDLNVQLETREPFLIRNNLAEGAANFNLFVVGSLREPRLKGSVSILRGQFRYNNREFDVRSGSIQFTDQLSNIPTYDVRADSEITDYRVNIRLLGGPGEQKILYSSSPPLSEKDILSLISFGLPSSAPELNKQGGTTRSTSLSGISYATGQLQDKIEGQLSANFGIRRFHLLPAYFEKTEQTELELTVGTDLVRDRLLVNYSTFLTSAQGGQRVELDLKLNRIVSLVGSWKDDGDGLNNFGADMRFRFEFD
jgi:autotransporter translocation and assembly factor TamB